MPCQKLSVASREGGPSTIRSSDLLIFQREPETQDFMSYLQIFKCWLHSLKNYVWAERNPPEGQGESPGPPVCKLRLGGRSSQRRSRSQPDPESGSEGRVVAKTQCQRLRGPAEKAPVIWSSSSPPRDELPAHRPPARPPAPAGWGVEGGWAGTEVAFPTWDTAVDVFARRILISLSHSPWPCNTRK